ncbi:hypothetical protein F5884DRAFT_144436 [Xylogone sp. PMI_703]|nr:hypothetical protein F5884DRAFT_144436 [Xylogone sp. PMI_703]
MAAGCISFHGNMLLYNPPSGNRIVLRLWFEDKKLNISCLYYPFDWVIMFSKSSMQPLTQSSPARYTCLKCATKFSRATDRDRHIAEVHGPKLACPSPGCTYHAARLYRVKAHFLQKHFPRSNVMPCTETLCATRYATERANRQFPILQTMV